MCCAVAAQACGTARPVERPVAEDGCIVVAEPVVSDTIALALDGVVDPAHAPVPATLAERSVFGHVYEPLIRVDCQGRVRPGLATTWQREDGGRRWVFVLRADAAFADGIPLTASAVAASWRLDEQHRPRPWADSVGGSVVVLGERELSVRLDRPHASVPAVFAHPGLAVARPSPDGSPWPVGTGAYTVTEVSHDRVVAVPRGAMERDALPTLVVTATGDDARDLVDAGFDLLVTRDPAVSAYALAAGSARSVPLPWNVVYVLAVPAEPGDPGGLATIRVREDFTAAAVGAAARTPDGTFWWEGADCVPPTVAASSGSDRAGRIVYRRGDRTARGVAQRLVALAASGRLRAALPSGGAGPRPAATGLDAARYDVALRDGADLGYVVALDRTVLDPCVAIRSITEAAPWPARLVPLVETRAQLVVRRLSGAVAVDWDGAPLLAISGREP